MSTEVIKQSRSHKLKDNMHPPKKRKRSFSLEKRRAVAGYIFVLPWIAGFLIFLLYPLVTSLIYSFNKVEIVAGKVKLEYVGTENYYNLLFKDLTFLPEKFWPTMKTTLLWTPFIVVFAMFIAILLNRKIKFRGLFRLIYFLPVLLGTGLVFEKISGVATNLSVPYSLSRSLAYILPGLASSLQSIIEQILAVFWKTGVQIIIFLAGLQSIPDSLYEAAKVDNANAWDMFWKVTIPMLSPVILLNTVYTIISSFRDESNELVGYIIDRFSKRDFSATNAAGWLYFLVVFIIVGITFLLMRRSVYYEK